METYAITIIGPDRAGIVNELSAAIASHSGNWLESHMANLAGQFAGIIEVQVDSANAKPLLAELRKLESNALNVMISAARPDAAELNAEKSAERLLEIELVGSDQPGIVRDITTALAANGSTIELMETECFSGSMSGEQLFKAQLKIRVPGNLSTDELEAVLTQVSADLMMDIVIEGS